MTTETTNDFKATCSWEETATRIIPPLFGLDVYCDYWDMEHNNVHGTDSLVKNFCGKRYCPVDWKWTRFWNYENVWFALEDKQKNGEAWTDNKTAMEDGVIIVVPYKNWKPYGQSTIQLVGYNLWQLHGEAERRRKEHYKTTSAKGSGTLYWACGRNELRHYEIWQSKEVPLATLKEKLDMI